MGDGLENYRLLMDPNDMTPEEQTQRIIQLLAKACVRAAQKAKQEGDSPGKKSLDLRANKLYPSVPMGGGGPGL